MTTDLNWVPTPSTGRLAVASRPRGGDWLDDEIRAWRRAGVDTIVSLLEPGEAADLDLAGEPLACEAHGIAFVLFPIPDRGTPASRPAFAELAGRVADELAAGRTVAVHCRQGIGRAGMVAAAVLITVGLGPDAAMQAVTASRGRPVPETPEQRHWLTAFADFVSPGVV